jgi:hypothetical protein
MKKLNLKILIIVMPLIIISCWSTDPYAESELNVLNGTGDTLVICYTKIISNGSHYLDLQEIYPYEYLHYGGSLKQSASLEDLIYDPYVSAENDTVAIFKVVGENEGTPFRDRSGNTTLYVGDSCLAKWGGPVAELPSDIHSFFNSNSWVFSKGGVKCKCTIATFTITEEDLKTDNN